nr:hypothetical protein [Tanacetum cinerariifolium]
GEDPMAYLNNLRQTSTIKVYQDEFDALLSKVAITESQVVSMFLGGMNTYIAMMVRMFKPRTLANTYCLANLKEATNESRIKSKPVYTNFRNVSSTSFGGFGRVLATPDGEEEEFSGEEGLEECLTMRVKVQANRQPIHILVNCRSTHNFLDLHKEKQLGCDLKATCPLQNSMAVGSQLVSQYMSRETGTGLIGD